MAEWVSVTVSSSSGSCTFSAIGRPFAFAWYGNERLPGRTLRAFHEPVSVPSMDKIEYLDYELQSLDDEEHEQGWYLYGVGHHELWCGTVLEEAVDEAQHHMLWDGSDPTSLSMIPARRYEGSNCISHRLPDTDPSVWEDDELWFGLFTPFPRKERTEREP